MTQRLFQEASEWRPGRKARRRSRISYERGRGGRERTVPASELHDADIEKAKAADRRAGAEGARGRARPRGPARRQAGNRVHQRAAGHLQAGAQAQRQVAGRPGLRIRTPPRLPFRRPGSSRLRLQARLRLRARRRRPDRLRRPGSKVTSGVNLVQKEFKSWLRAASPKSRKRQPPRSPRAAPARCSASSAPGRKRPA